MREVINYMLEANFALLAFLFAYKMLFRNENAFGLLRFYLLCSILLSLTLPLLHFSSPTRETSLSIGNVIPEYWLPEISVGNINPAVKTELPRVGNTWSIITGIYLIGAAIATLWLACQIGYVIFLCRHSKSYKIDRYRIIESNEDKPTFSFFNVIYLGNSQTLTDIEKQQIIRHEMIHARQLHSMDILLITVVKNIFWFNPFLKQYKDLFIQLHEFEADARAVENSDVDQYCSLLARVALQSHFPIASHFNESLTVKRIEMMRTLKKRIKKWKVAVVFAIVSGCFVAIACNDQLANDLEKSTISQSGDYPPAVRAKMDEFLKNHPESKLSFFTGTSEDVDKLANSTEVKNRVIYLHSFGDNDKKGILLSDVEQYAESLQTDDKVFMMVEQQPEFPGGYDALKSFLSENIKYPTQSVTKGEEGTVYVSFVIDETGKVTDPKVLRGVSEALDAEALRVTRMMPAWKAGTQDGKNVKVRYNIPIKFEKGFKVGQNYEVPKPAVGQLESSEYKLKLIQFGKKDGSQGKRFLVGKVTDENGNPLSGLHVIIKGTTTGSTTDSQGSFSIETDLASGELVLSHIGFESKTVSF